MNRLNTISVLCILAVVFAVLLRSNSGVSTRTSIDHAAGRSAAPPLDASTGMVAGLASPFVPNLGQWPHRARFVHRGGSMTLFVEDRGWVIDCMARPTEPRLRRHGPGVSPVHDATLGDGDVKERTRGVAVRMTFEGDLSSPDIVGEEKLPGHNNYFLGNKESRWRTGVPLYGSVRYRSLYPGIDLRLREKGGVPEYDLLLQPDADLSQVTVHVEGAQRMSIAGDGSLVIETALGRVIQPVPETWQVDRDGGKRRVICNFTLLGADRFGFLAPGWDGGTSLTIDPALIWSTLLGGDFIDFAWAGHTDANGVVTVSGHTGSTNYPTTIGAYDRSLAGYDVFVSRLDPRKVGAAQLVYSTFLGGGGNSEFAYAVSVDDGGVVTVAGQTSSPNFPTTTNAYDRIFNGGGMDAFLSRLDPARSGSAQLVYSTFLGGSFYESIYGISVSATGVVTVAGRTNSPSYPTTTGAYDNLHNGGMDGFVTRLDPGRVRQAQLVYSTFLGGKGDERVDSLGVDILGFVTVAGRVTSTDFPTTKGAHDRVLTGWRDGFVSQLDLTKTGAGQLTYSTYLGGNGDDAVTTLNVVLGGVVTVSGWTRSTDFPTTAGALATTYTGGYSDAFVSRLDPRAVTSAQLVYSTYLGGRADDWAFALAVDANGVMTVAGQTNSTNFPTTVDAYDTTYNGPFDAFVSRLDPNRTRAAQLVHSTFLGSSDSQSVVALAVDPSGVATVVGRTIGSSSAYPTTPDAFKRSLANGDIIDAFVSRLSMGVALYGDVHEISINAGGTQRLIVNAGKARANRSYWIFGSITGTKPGVNLLGVHIPLNPDLYTDVAMGAVNTTVFTKFRGTLDASGLATASFNVPANLPLPSGFRFHHAYVVYDASGKFYMASNAVPLTLK